MQKNINFGFGIGMAILITIAIIRGIMGIEGAAVYKVYTDETNNAFRNNINETSSGLLSDSFKYNIVDNQTEADILILRTSDKEVEGYKKLSEFFYSPIILFANDEANEDSTYSYISHDFYSIMDGLVSNKNWEEVDFSKNFEGEMIVRGPRTTSAYYNDVKDFISLNIEKAKVSYTADDVLEKIQDVSDVSEAMLKDTEDKEAPETLVYIGPEYLVANTGFLAGYSRYSYNEYLPVYPEYTTAIYWDVFIKEDNEEALMETITDEAIFEDIGLRAQKHDFVYDSHYASPSVNVEKIEKEKNQ